MNSDYTDIDISNIKFVSPKLSDDNNYIAISNIDNKDIIFTTPKMKCISIELSNDNYILELEFSKKQWNFFKFISSLDDHNIILIDNNSNEWFEQTFPLDVIDDFYHSNIKINRNNTAPIFKLKFNKNKIIKITNEKGLELNLNEINENLSLCCASHKVSLS